VAQWQKHPASIWKVPGSNPNWIPDFSAEFFLSPITCISFHSCLHRTFLNVDHVRQAELDQLMLGTLYAWRLPGDVLALISSLCLAPRIQEENKPSVMDR